MLSMLGNRQHPPPASIRILLRTVSSRAIIVIIIIIFVSITVLVRECASGACDIPREALGQKWKVYGHTSSDKSTSTSTSISDAYPGNQTTGHGSQSALLDECAHFPNTSSVLLVMKTGATEAHSKIPTQLLTMLKCLPDFLLFSDVAEEIAGYSIYDSLESVLDKVKYNQDFDIYHRQKQCPVEREQCNRNYDHGKEAWNLDKYKNIHMAEKAYKIRPNYDWYLFVDADTYVSFASLVQWLPELNPDKHHYIGSLCYLGNFGFAHGGTGYLVSKGTMHSMFFGKTGVANLYDEPVSKVCCGDYMWGKAVQDFTGRLVENAVSNVPATTTSVRIFSQSEVFLTILSQHSGPYSTVRNRELLDMTKTNGVNLLSPCTTLVRKKLAACMPLSATGSSRNLCE